MTTKCPFRLCTVMDSADVFCSFFLSLGTGQKCPVRVCTVMGSADVFCSFSQSRDRSEANGGERMTRRLLVKVLKAAGLGASKGELWALPCELWTSGDGGGGGFWSRSSRRLDWEPVKVSYRPQVTRRLLGSDQVPVKLGYQFHNQSINQYFQNHPRCGY